MTTATTADISNLPREFVWLGQTYADPDPGMNIVDVRNQYAAMLPDLTNAAISDAEIKNGKRVYTFKKATGTKG